MISTIIKEELEKYITNKNNITLYHYSSLNQDEILLSPDKFGKNYFTKNDERTSGKKRIFFYVTPEEKERFFMNSNLYKADVNVNEIYDLKKDYNNFIYTAKGNNNGALSFDMLFEMILQNGYKGIFYMVSGRSIVIWFEQILVTKVDKETSTVR
jgi:hypothetical protein